MNPSEVSLFVSPEGELSFVYSDELMAALGELGEVRTARVSHVEPAPDGKSWLADMSPLCGEKVVLGPFASRAEALAAEQAWVINWLEKTGDACGELETGDRAVARPA